MRRGRNVPILDLQPMRASVLVVDWIKRGFDAATGEVGQGVSALRLNRFPHGALVSHIFQR
jgi:hypothetical protein